MSVAIRAALHAIVLGLAALPLTGGEGAATAAGFHIRDGDRVVFYGDSITDNEWYPTLVESYVLTRHPAWRNHFSNRGVSGDSAGSIARFTRDVLAQKPDVCTYNMGFNDGGFFSFSSAALATWLSNVERSVNLARAADPRLRLVLMSPIVSESSVSLDPRWITREVYPYAMLSFGSEEARLAERLTLPFIDLGRQYGQTMGLGQVTAGSSFTLSRDGVHPLRAGQALIAYHVLRGLGADGLVANTELDATALSLEAAVVAAERCQISGLSLAEQSLTGSALSFTHTCDALPMPIPPEVRPFTFLVRYEDDLSRDLLRVRNLTAPAYALTIDDRHLVDLSADDLAAGINLSQIAATPMHDQALTVMAAVRTKQQAEYAFFSHWINGPVAAADGAGRPLAAATAEDRAAMLRDQQHITDLKNAAYQLCAPQARRFRLTPLTAAVPRFATLVAADIAQPRLEVQLTPLAVDWNTLTARDRQVTVTVSNPGTIRRSAALSWAMKPGWLIEPRTQSVILEPGASTSLACVVTAASGTSLLQPPTLTTRWSWSAAWAAPTTTTRQIELAPRLRVARAARLPTFTGTWADWDQATPLQLDDATFINPAVPGRRSLWRGPADLSAAVRLLWHADALLVAALVRDDSHVQDAGPGLAWSQDCLMLAASTQRQGMPAGRYEFLLAAHAERTDIITHIGVAAADVPPLRCVSHLDAAAGTCLYEIAIPWGRLAPALPSAGMTFGLTLCVGDADSDPAKGFNYLSWTPGINYGKNPLDLAQIELAP